ncbi:MAG: TetR/AcrR family transcriptional regulator [Nannocystaceae bacterium]
MGQLDCAGGWGLQMTRQKTDEQRKQQIRAAATRCFVRRGYAATRLLDIAREAGLSKGGVYFHYRAKEQLFHDILDAQLAAFEERWSFEPVADQPADVTIANLVRAHVRTIEDNPDETRLTNLLVTMAVMDAEFREKLDKAWAVSRQLYGGVIARGIADGLFRDADADAMAHNVLALVQGYSAQSALDSEGRLPVAIDEIIRGVLRMLGSNAEVPAERPAASEAAPQAEAPAQAGASASEAGAPAPEAAAPATEAATEAAPEGGEPE